MTSYDRMLFKAFRIEYVDLDLPKVESGDGPCNCGLAEYIGAVESERERWRAVAVVLGVMVLGLFVEWVRK